MTSEFEQWRITRELHAQIKLEAAKTGLKMHELATMAWRCYLEAKSGHKIVDQPKPDKLDGHIEELEKHLGGLSSVLDHAKATVRKLSDTHHD
jgi:hypothetical protein